MEIRKCFGKCLHILGGNSPHRASASTQGHVLARVLCTIFLNKTSRMSYGFQNGVMAYVFPEGELERVGGSTVISGT